MEEKSELTIDQKIELMKLAFEYNKFTFNPGDGHKIDVALPKAYQQIYKIILETPLTSE